MNGIFWVYCLENKINGKKYIGKAVNPKRRLESHISISKKESKYQKYLHKAIAKYGIENFWFRCISFCLSEKEALEQEKEFISLFKTTNPKLGYNLTNGGEGNSGYKHTVETKKKLSELGKKKIGEFNSFHGKTHNDEVKIKLRNARRKITDEQISFIFKSKNKGISVSEIANKINISKSHIYEILNGKYWKGKS